MTLPRRCHTRQQKATHRRLQKARERHLQAFEQAIRELGLPETVMEEVEWRLHAQGKLLAGVFGLMFPPPFLAVGPRVSSVRYRAG